jgi:hypothetical protein
MKDLSSSSRGSRYNALGAKKRTSPHGIQKRKSSATAAAPPLPPSHSPRARLEAAHRRQREQQLVAWKREGIYLEEEYHEEIQRFLHDMEKQTMGSTSSMDQQPEIKWHMRPCLVDFLVELHFTFRLRPETLYLCLNIIDRYVSRRIVYIKHYQLVGCAALWIAAKFEDAKERVPSVEELVHYCRDTYDASAFIQMEAHVLQTIQWTLGHPTAEAWLRMLCCSPAPHMEEAKVQHVARFLMEITLFYREFIQYPPSAIAFASLTLARFICGKERRVFDETDECLDVVEHLDERLSKHVNDLSETLIKKYSYAFYSKAATLVVQYYLQGGRFIRQSLTSVAFPMTPARSYTSPVRTPMSATTAASDMSDEMPVTPTSPAFSSDFYSSVAMSDDKENMSSPSQSLPTIHKRDSENVQEQYLPHEYVTHRRKALQSFNSSSPRTAMVS